MAEKLTWEFELIDKVSKNTDEITKRLDQLAGKLQEVDKKSGLTALATSFTALKGAAGSAFGFVQGALGGAINIGEKILGAASEAETLRKSFEAILGVKGAKEFADTAQTIADNTKFTDEQISAAARPLLMAGLRGQELTNALTVGLDRAAKLGGGIDDVKAVSETLSMIELTGKVGKKQIAGLGLHAEDFFGQLGKQLGVSSAEAEKLAGAGKIKGLVNAVTNTFASIQGGQLGAGAGEARNTLAGITAKLKEVPLDFFKGLNETAGFKKLTEFLVKLYDQIKPSGPLGTKIVAGINETFDKLFSGVDLEQLPAMIDKAIAFASDLWDTVTVIYDVIKAIGTGIQMVGEFIGEAAAEIFLFFESLVNFGESIGDGLGKAVVAVGEFAQMFYDTAINIGTRIWEGIRDGITAGLTAVKDAVVGLADGVAGSFKSALGIESPSKVFAGFGDMSAAGFAEGVTGRDFSSSATQLASNFQPGAGSKTIGSSVSGAVELHIHVDGGRGDAETIANKLSAMLPSALEDALGKLASEMGA